MAISDVYQLVDEQLLRGQTVLNVYFYQAQTTGLTAARLAAEWIDQVFVPIADLQTADLVHVQTRVHNLFNPADFALVANGNLGRFPGGTTVDCLPSFNNNAFRLARATSVVRNGQKRVAAVPETVVQDGTVNDATYLTKQATAATALKATLTDVATHLIAEFLPVIVKRILVSTTPHRTYRLPATLAETVVSTIPSVVPNVEITSQTSRKIGRGA